jgi:nucleoside-triphosphatase
MEQRHLLITGAPGSGKTTLVMRIIERLRGFRIAGFYTEEIRTAGTRKGFEIADIGGSRTLLAHVDISGGPTVGKYGVDVAGFEAYLERRFFLSPERDLIVIDEIGRMECLSPKFTGLITDLLDAPVRVAATIALQGAGIIDRIKKRPDVSLYTITRANRDDLVDAVEAELRKGLTRTPLTTPV